MKPEVRVKLLKEYESIKTKSDPHPIFWNILSLVFFSYMFVKCILMAGKDSLHENNIWFILICCLPLIALLWSAFNLAKKIYDKKMLLLLQAVLDLSEEKIYNEINDLDIQSKENEKNVIKEN